MRSRIGIVIAASVVIVAGAIVFYQRRTAGDADVRAATERIAAAIARGDRESLAGESFLRDHPDTVAWLMQHGPAISEGYRVSVKRNGADGYQLLSLADISHLGVIETARVTVRLGFRYEPDTNRLVFVTASAGTFGKWQ